jgi:hypothetical protein
VSMTGGARCLWRVSLVTSALYVEHNRAKLHRRRVSVDEALGASAEIVARVVRPLQKLRAMSSELATFLARG